MHCVMHATMATVSTIRYLTGVRVWDAPNKERYLDFFGAEPNMEAKYLDKLLIGLLIIAAKAKANTGKDFDI